MARILSLFMLIVASVAAAQACYSGCRFRFCDNSKVLRLGSHADLALTSSICDKRGNHIGVIGNTGEARLVRTNRRGFTVFRKISKWQPRGLKQRFSPSFFKSYSIRVAAYRTNKYGKQEKYYIYKPYSGVGRENFQQNQKSFLKRKCFALPIRAWQVLDGKKNVVRNVHRNYNPLYHCVAFQTRLY